MRKRQWAIIAVAAISMGTSASAFASELVYHPISPTLGGNPLNGSFLLSTAQGQGEGTKSGNQGPDLSGLDAALQNIGNGTDGGGGGGGGGGGAGGGGGTPQANFVRAQRNAAPLTSTATAGGSLSSTVP
jgi:curli production assembly/transport component CsgF